MALEPDGSPPPVPKQVNLFIVRLSSTMKALRLYPTGSDIPKRTATEALEPLHELLAADTEVEFDVTRDGLAYDGTAIFPKSGSFMTFGREFYRRNLAAFRFHPGVTPDEVLRFLSCIIMPPEELLLAGGIEEQMAVLGVVAISVTEAATRIFDTNLPGGEGELGVEKSVDELLDEAGTDQARDKRVLMRVLRDRNVVAAYLQEARKHGPDKTVEDMAQRIAALAGITRDELPDDQAAVLGVIADAIMDMAPTERGELYEEHLLDQAKRDELIAQIIRDLGVDEVVDSILCVIEETNEALTGLSRAVRNIALIDASSTKETVLERAVERLQEKGHSASFIEQVVNAAAPKRISSRAKVAPAEHRPVETVLRLIDMAPDGSIIAADDQALMGLQDEAARGTTDGDVTGALVTIAMLETRDAPFNSVISMLEDSVGFLVEAQETEVAADVAEAFAMASQDAEKPDEQRQRMAHIIQTIARPESLAKVTGILKRYKPDSPEYQACKRLIGVLGEAMIDPLLEVLADEPDRGVRKALVDLISASAREYIPELATRLGDKRWYLVRNVVQILGSTKSPDALPHLQRTLRHSDDRVRRETIHSLALIRTGMADSMLSAALSDDEAQNVQLVANHLATLGCKSAIPALEQVALGTGRGNRDIPTRIAAIEALGQLGSKACSGTLDELCRKRGLLGGGQKDREIRAAAEEALRVIAAASGSGVAQ